jgi:phosphoribosyl-AMP cyclohydrolase
MNALEEGRTLHLDFKKLRKVAAIEADVLPVAIQNADTRELILVAYTNDEAFEKSIASRSLVLWSTSRNELWEKGKTSGETFELVEARVNCEQNSLLYLVRPKRGDICHTQNQAGEARNCYYRKIDIETKGLVNMNP